MNTKHKKARILFKQILLLFRSMAIVLMRCKSD